MTNPDDPIHLMAPNIGGLTKREWFAGMAMQGLACNHAFATEDPCYAECAVSLADALIAELNETEEKK